MLDFTRSQLSNFVYHEIGNKGLGEPMDTSNQPTVIADSGVVFNFITQGFKSDIVYEFKKEIFGDGHYTVRGCVEDMFKNKEHFIDGSKNIANVLYNQTMHPKLAGGTMYVVYFKDVLCDGELVDAIGIFKKETVEKFVKMSNSGVGGPMIFTEEGYALDKMERGALILNTDTEKDYKVYVFDKSKSPAECSFYWTEDFLGVKLKDTSYYQTSHQLMQALSFCDEVLTQENNVSRFDSQTIQNKTLAFFNSKEKFDPKEFEFEVLGTNKDIISAYDSHKKDYQKTYEVKLQDNFDISNTAVKQKNKYSKTVIKLDDGIEISVKKDHNRLEKGYDDEAGMGFYKVYFIHEEIK